MPWDACPWGGQDGAEAWRAIWGGGRVFQLEQLGVQKALLLPNPQAALCALRAHTHARTHVHSNIHKTDVRVSKHTCPMVCTHVNHYTHTYMNT